MSVSEMGWLDSSSRSTHVFAGRKILPTRSFKDYLDTVDRNIPHDIRDMIDQTKRSRLPSGWRSPHPRRDVVVQVKHRAEPVRDYRYTPCADYGMPCPGPHARVSI